MMLLHSTIQRLLRSSWTYGHSPQRPTPFHSLTHSRAKHPQNASAKHLASEPPNERSLYFPTSERKPTPTTMMVRQPCTSLHIPGLGLWRGARPRRLVAPGARPIAVATLSPSALAPGSNCTWSVSAPHPSSSRTVSLCRSPRTTASRTRSGDALGHPVSGDRHSRAHHVKPKPWTSRRARCMRTS